MPFFILILISYYICHLSKISYFTTCQAHSIIICLGPKILLLVIHTHERLCC